MSIVTVHGPNTMYSKGVVQNASGTASATVSPTNGLIWTFKAKDQSQVAANYDWAYTGLGGTPASPIADTKSPTITFAGAGTATVTLTLNGVAQAPITVKPVVGTGPTSGLMSLPPEDDEQQSLDDGDEDPPEIDVGFDPAAHTITEVEDFVNEHPDEAIDVLDLEEAGKNRVTLVAWLENFIDQQG